MRKNPDVVNRKILSKSRIFTVEAVDLRFSNGTEVTFERLLSRGRGAVMMAAIHDDHVLLVREYAAGVERYELGFPKGIIEGEEDPITAANREMQEEIGYAANELQIIRSMTAAPGFIDADMTLILAQDLYPSSLPGDEPEDIEVVPWPLAELEKVFDEPDFTEARSIAAVYLIKDFLA